jgi:hypothetical protein
MFLSGIFSLHKNYTPFESLPTTAANLPNYTFAYQGIEFTPPTPLSIASILAMTKLSPLARVLFISHL